MQEKSRMGEEKGEEMQIQPKKATTGFQFVSKMTTMGKYFYLRVPNEHADSAKKMVDRGEYLIVTVREAVE